MSWLSFFISLLAFVPFGSYAKDLNGEISSLEIQMTKKEIKKNDEGFNLLAAFFSELPNHLSFADYELGLDLTSFFCDYFYTCPTTKLQSDMDIIIGQSQDEKLLGYDHLKPKKAKKPKKYTMLDGRDIFMKNCMSCHLNSENDQAPQLANFEQWGWRIQSSLDFLVYVTILGKKAYQDSQMSLSNQNNSQYVLDSVETVTRTEYDDQVRGCLLPRGGCSDCDDAQIIAVVKYMAQAAVRDNTNYQLW